MTLAACSSDRRRVLIIAYIFPPIGGSGVQRTLKFVKYLPQFGWEPVVVCGDEARPFGYGYDETLLAEVPPEARVLHTRFVSPYGVRGRLQRLFRVRPTIASEDQPAPAGGQEDPAAGKGWEPAGEGLRRLSRVLHPLESPPIDSAFYWALSIVPLCRRVIETEKVDLIYTSSHPYSDHVAGWILKRLTSRPWVADFRDPWTQAWDYSNRGWSRRFDPFAEQRVLRYADRIIGVTPSQTQGLLDLAPGRDPLDFVTIENGFDEKDFRSNDMMGPPGNRTGKTLLSYVGIVYDGTAVPFLQALERLGPAGEKLRVRFVGGLARQELAWLKAHPLDVEVEVLGRVPHTEAIDHMRASDAVLLIFGEGSRWARIYTGKLLEYMRCGSPILMIGPEGDAAELVRISGTGCFVPCNDVDAAAETLRLLAEQPDVFRARYFHPDPQVIARYERRALTARLAALFDDAVRSVGRPINA